MKRVAGIRHHSRVPNPAALRWRTARHLIQVASLLLFLFLLAVTRGGQFPATPPSLFFRLNPLSLVTTSIAERQWVASLALALVTLALTVAAGRVWCGWICPLGTVLDLFRWRRKSRAGTAASPLWRAVKYVVLVAILGAALAGNQTLLVLDPISLLTRGLASFLFPGLNQLLIAVEHALYSVPWLEAPLDWLEGSVRTPLFSADVWRWWNLLPGVLLLAVIGLNVFAERFWCRYLCPLGGLLGLVSRVAILRRMVGKDACRQCVRCVRACPTGTIDPNHGFASDPAECTVCLECLPECPAPGGQTFAPVRGLAPAREYNPGRRLVLSALGTGFASAAMYSLLPAGLRRSVRLIRPPGAQQNEQFLSACLRCGECLKVCPTSGLQPALWEAGLDGLWTPTLVPRLGYCDYACHACGQVCPTGAIPDLTLEVKRTTTIGTAEVDRKRCLPWSENTPCIVCEEMCPLAPKAIELDSVSVTDAEGQVITLQRPLVLAERCIGCGICEYKCPLQDEAAIQVIQRGRSSG